MISEEQKKTVMYDADLAFADLMCDMKNYFPIGTIDPVARRLCFNDQWDIVHSSLYCGDR